MKRIYFKIILLAGLISLACTTRVSEWVLLNSIPNHYTLVYFHNTPISESIKRQNLAITERIETCQYSV